MIVCSVPVPETFRRNLISCSGTTPKNVPGTFSGPILTLFSDLSNGPLCYFAGPPFGTNRKGMDLRPVSSFFASSHSLPSRERSILPRPSSTRYAKVPKSNDVIRLFRSGPPSPLLLRPISPLPSISIFPFLPLRYQESILSPPPLPRIRSSHFAIKKASSHPPSLPRKNVF